MSFPSGDVNRQSKSGNDYSYKIADSDFRVRVMKVVIIECVC